MIVVMIEIVEIILGKKILVMILEIEIEMMYYDYKTNTKTNPRET